MNGETPGRNQGLVPARKESVLSLIQYQAASVVSRTLINLSEGTVTLFAFDEGEGLSEHTSPYDALLHILEGEALVRIADERFEMLSGDAVILPSGKPHAVVATKRFKMMLTMIRHQR